MFTNREITVSAYEAILSHELNWLVLRYSNDNPDDLELYSYGSDGLEQLKATLSGLEGISVIFYRDQAEDDSTYTLVTLIPSSTSPVPKARALVHSRRVGTVFNVQHTMLTIESPSQLTTTTIRKAVLAPDSPPSSPPLRPVPTMGASLSSEAPRSRIQRNKPKPITLDLTRRSFSETYAPHYPIPQQAPPVPPMPSIFANSKPSGMLGGLLRPRKRRNHTLHASHDVGDDLPPPIPPKDDFFPSKSTHQLYSPVDRRSPPPILLYSPKIRGSPPGSLSELGVISHAHDHYSYNLATTQLSGPPPPPKAHKTDLTLEQWKSIPLRGKWARDATLSDPKEREARRREAQRQREREEEEAVEEERRCQEEKRRLKEEATKREEEEEIDRKRRLEQELRFIASEKERKRQLEEEEEARKRLEIEERKRADRERRCEEHRRLEQWRKEREREAAEEARRAEMAKVQAEAERQRKIQQAEKLVAQAKSKEPAVTTGWVTIQFHDSLFWKRRYYRVIGDTLHLHRSPKDLHATLETVQLRGTVGGLKEWKDGYEELEAIPFSFVVEFKDDRQAWSMYADSEQDKFRFLGLVNHAAGL
ncbi:hypothetical protein FA13DRAFT_1726818 [Coprinellus micaceus]|uniref:ADF-H domain-containing protein n=1 Tax=Coprinellus micaceus TaxID=71717 RepID=A0A4Y7TQM5_COPMI|nr:hypothetical protein FA13DRAFT_1726818 [Coprinellus micaceus]